MNFISDIIKDVIKEHYEYISECEIRSTENEKHILKIKEYIMILKANTEISRKYFHQKMNERDYLFNMANEALEKSIEIGNYEMSEVAMSMIKFINEVCPFNWD